VAESPQFRDYTHGSPKITASEILLSLSKETSQFQLQSSVVENKPF